MYGPFYFSPQSELKTLQETASPSFSFANDLIKHNLVRMAQFVTYCPLLEALKFRCTLLVIFFDTC